jgi:phenylpropionate dioxygenase-like ring-hydroxylating dioxygenase large terminal subunit
MIKNQWYAILDSKEVKINKAKRILRMNEKLVIWRDSKNKLHCIFDRCCHRGASLGLGCVKGDQLECPFHGLVYNGEGQVTLIPANGKASQVEKRFKVNSYLVKEAYGLIWIWYSDSKEHVPEIPFFEDLKEGFAYHTFKEIWNVHYTRAIENQLDVVHLPFVHATTIGKGNKTIVNGPVVKWEGDLMHFYVDNVQDNGENKAKKTSDMIDYENLFQLQYQVPNIWQNLISKDLKVFAAFAPIDETHTMIYLRFYQKFMTVPFIGKGISVIGSQLNKKILHQDRRVVVTQLPKKSQLKMEEQLIPGDLPIIEFRKKREKLKKENN